MLRMDYTQVITGKILKIRIQIKVARHVLFFCISGERVAQGMSI